MRGYDNSMPPISSVTGQAAVTKHTPVTACTLLWTLLEQDANKRYYLVPPFALLSVDKTKSLTPLFSYA